VKTAISIPDALFKRAERFAQKRALSRSQLYATALEEHLARYSDREIIKSYDEARPEV